MQDQLTKQLTELLQGLDGMTLIIDVQANKIEFTAIQTTSEIDMVARPVKQTNWQRHAFRRETPEQAIADCIAQPMTICPPFPAPPFNSGQ